MSSSGQQSVEQGTFVLADISGYTAFLQAVGVAHADDMAAGNFVPRAYELLTSLLDGIVEKIAPPFTLSKLEGDAVFAFGSDDQPLPRGRELVDCLNGCYTAYRGRVDEARELMICDCDACLTIGELELKFVLHHGNYVVQSVAGQPELLGPDVTVAHLLLKNHAAELIGRRAYALITDAAGAHLEVPPDGAQPIVERYEHYPPVPARVLALS